MEGQCQYTPHCHVAKNLWEHVLKCTLPTCQYPRCLASRELLKHHQNCKDARCPVCGPVRSAMLKQRSQMLQQQQQQGGGGGSQGGSQGGGQGGQGGGPGGQGPTGPPAKRMKMEGVAGAGGEHGVGEAMFVAAPPPSTVKGTAGNGKAKGPGGEVGRCRLTL